MSGERILVLDDNLQCRSLYSELLRQQGYTVVAVEDGAEGINAVRKAYEEQKPFDLYVSDVRMPNVDGPGFYNQIEEEGINGSPIIFVSGGMDNSQRDRINELNPVAVLPKPFELTSFLKTVEDALHHNQDLESRLPVPTQPTQNNQYLA